jgi:hypothetical protein
MAVSIPVRIPAEHLPPIVRDWRERVYRVNEGDPAYPDHSSVCLPQPWSANLNAC